MNTFIRRVGVTAVCTVSAIAFSATAAGAGEITGNGRYISGSPDAPLRAKSICAYSGQNDGFHDPSQVEFPGDADMRVQSYGQAVRSGQELPAFLRPGSACNGHTGFLSGGGGH